MSDFERIFDLALLQERWSAQTAAQRTKEEPAAPPPQALAVLRLLEEQIDKDLGPRRRSVQPALTEVRTLLTALHPQDGPSLLDLAQQAEHTRRLQAGLNRLEDLLEALCLSGRQGRSA